MIKKIYLLIIVMLVLVAVNVLAIKLNYTHIEDEYVHSFVLIGGYEYSDILFDGLEGGVGDSFNTRAEEVNQKFHRKNDFCLMFNDSYEFDNITIHIPNDNHAAKTIDVWVSNISFNEMNNDSTTSLAWCGSQLGVGQACDHVLNDLGTDYWLSALNGNKNITIDFGSQKSFNSASWIHYWGTRYNTYWRYWGSNDNSSWTSIANFSEDASNKLISHYDELGSQSYRYLRWEINGSNDGYAGGKLRVYNESLTNIYASAVKLGNLTYSAINTNQTLNMNGNTAKVICLNTTSGFSNRGYMDEIYLYGSAVLPPSNSVPYYSGSISNISIDYSNYSSILIGDSYFIRDDDNDTMNCSLYVNDTIVYNFTSITNNTELNYTWTGMTKHETLEYYYNCTDGEDYNVSNSYYLIYENTVCSNSANPTNYPWSSGSENKTYSNTVTDLDGDLMSVYSFWNGTLNQTNNSVSSGSTINIIKELIAHNDYTHQWYCIDPYQASNTTTSSYYSNYTQACPVQSINLGSFTFNTAYTENFTVNSTDVDGDNVTIYFYWNGILDSINSSYTLGTNWTVQKALANETSYTYYWITIDDYCNTTSSTYNVAWSGSVSASGDDFSYLILLLILAYAFAYFVVSKRSNFLAGIIYLLGALAVLVIGTSTFTTMLGMVLILGSLGVLIGDVLSKK